MTRSIQRMLTTLLAISLSFSPLAQAAPPSTEEPTLPTLISTEQAAAAQPGRVRLEQALARADVVAGLQMRGVSIEAARARVAALTDAEAAQVAAQFDEAPAGGDVLGVLLTVFLVLLVTDILGFTKVFPFTRAIR